MSQKTTRIALARAELKKFEDKKKEKRARVFRMDTPLSEEGKKMLEELENGTYATDLPF